MEESNIKEIWETYRTCWSEAHSSKRNIRLQEIISDDFEYHDPNIEIEGYLQLSDYMIQFQKEFVGCSFIITDFNVHHNKSLAHWNMISANNEVVGNGVDFASYTHSKLKTITSFFKES